MEAFDIDMKSEKTVEEVTETVNKEIRENIKGEKEDPLKQNFDHMTGNQY